MREAEAMEQQQGGKSQQELKREEREKAMLSHAARTRGTDQR